MFMSAHLISGSAAASTSRALFAASRRSLLRLAASVASRSTLGTIHTSSSSAIPSHRFSPPPRTASVARAQVSPTLLGTSRSSRVDLEAGRKKPGPAPLANKIP
ncbi:hypothetical protein JCM11641_002478 [Rhodosporidiobolus odoratus]